MCFEVNNECDVSCFDDSESASEEAGDRDTGLTGSHQHIGFLEGYGNCITEGQRYA